MPLSPKPEYLDKMACSSGFACRCSSSIVLSVLIAAILASKREAAPALKPISECSLSSISLAGDGTGRGGSSVSRCSLLELLS